MQKDFRELTAVERQLIENEHAHLEQFLWELHEACCEFDSLKECHGCDKEKFASCQGRLISFEYVFIDFVIRHFENEEKIMSEICYTQNAKEFFHMHVQEHEKLLLEMESLMHKLSAESEQGFTAGAIRELYYRVAELFGKHASTFDNLLMNHPESGKK